MFGGGYCKYCQGYRKDKTLTKVERKKYTIRPYSVKRQAIQSKEYIPKMLRFLSTREVCEIASPVCTYRATVVNHVRGRQTVERLLDDRYWEASCAACNSYIETHPELHNFKHKQSKYANDSE